MIVIVIHLCTLDVIKKIPNVNTISILNTHHHLQNYLFVKRQPLKFSFPLLKTFLIRTTGNISSCFCISLVLSVGILSLLVWKRRPSSVDFDFENEKMARSQVEWIWTAGVGFLAKNLRTSSLAAMQRPRIIFSIKLTRNLFTNSK